MSVTVHLACNGCFAETKGTAPLRRRFYGSRGDWGLGSYATDHIESVAPEGWVMFDPYTQMTYCPGCWASIEGSATAVEAGAR